MFPCCWWFVIVVLSFFLSFFLFACFVVVVVPVWGREGGEGCFLVVSVLYFSCCCYCFDWAQSRLTAVVLFFVCFLFCLFVCLFCCFPLVLFHLAFFFFFLSPAVLLNHTAETLRVSVRLVSAWQKLSWIDYI